MLIYLFQERTLGILPGVTYSLFGSASVARGMGILIVLAWTLALSKGSRLGDYGKG
jgi:hypothetical protein